MLPKSTDLQSLFLRRPIKSILLIAFLCCTQYSFAQPSNDDFSNAIVVTGLINGCSAAGAFTTVNATADGNAGSEWNGGLVDNNVWFSFVAPTNGQINIRLVRGTSPAAIRYAQMALWESDGTTEIRSENWYTQYDNVNIGHVGLTPGNTYFISVDSHGTSTTGTFALCLEDTLDYDFYEGAIDVTPLMNGCSANAVYSSYGASADRNMASEWSAGGPRHNRWFRFDAPPTGEVRVIVRRGGGPGDPLGTQRFTQLAIWEADGTTEIASDNFDSSGSHVDANYLGLTPGSTYYISVDSYAGQGTFTLCLNDQVDYDMYEGAIDVTSLVNTFSSDGAYNTLGASPDLNPGSAWGPGGPRANRWFHFVAPNTNQINITVDIGGVKGTQTRTLIALWEADGVTEVSSTIYSFVNEDVVLRVPGLIAGNTYYISVDAHTNSYRGSFTLGLATDNDSDGVGDLIDLDDDNDGILDSTEGSTDLDGDSLGNDFDLDSDGDGIPDNVEAQITTNYIAPNADNLATYISNNGVNSAYLGGLTPTNTDGTDNTDYLDTDSDNEGTDDTSEANIALSNSDSDNDGLDDTTDVSVDYSSPGGSIESPINGALRLPDLDNDANSGGDVDFRDAIDNRRDTDGDGILDMVDLDDDNDGILDTIEGCENTDISGTIGIGNSVTDTTYGLNGTDLTYNLNNPDNVQIYGYDAGLSGLSIRLQGDAGDSGSLTSTYSTPISNVFFKMTDFDHNTRCTVEVYDENNILYDLTVEGIAALGTEITQTGNFFEANSGDSDGNDPLDDAIGSIIFYFERQVSRIVLNFEYPTDSSTRFIQPTYCILDSDGDGLINNLDLDSDNDGIYDIMESAVLDEAGVSDTDSNGLIDGLPTDFGMNGLYNAIEDVDTIYANTTYVVAESVDDSDLLPNFLDLDSDGDGIPDNVEAQTTIGYSSPAGAVDTNGVDTAYALGLVPTNTDLADLPDYLDTDSDNEGANDTAEAVITLTGNDIDNDGLDDATDADGSGYLDSGGTIDDPLSGAIQLPDTDEDATLGGDVDFRDTSDERPDTDNDGYVDAVDLDDDNDGVLDSEELNVVISNSQPDCTNETILDFSTAPILESGTALQQGAVYRFPNVTTGTDALVTIFMTFNAYVSDIDNNSAEAQAFRPRTGFDISNVGKKGFIEYRLQFVNSGGNTPVIIDKFFMNINDTDGNPSYSEEIWVNSPTSYIISNPTELTIAYNNPWVIAFGGTTEYPGAGNTFPQVNFGINYISRSEISFRAGITTIVPAVAASGREHNIDFRCTTNYINPSTYGLDIDGDGINNNLDTDSDGDGCNDADEAYGDSNTDLDDNGMFGDGVPSVNSDGTVNGASYQTPVDNDTNGTPDFLEVGAVPLITVQPLDAFICEGENVSFVVASDADGFQWQIDNGSGWTDLIDSGIHSGTNTDTLTITNAQVAHSGALYQVILTNSGYICGSTISDSVGLVVSIVPDVTIGDASEIEGGNIIFPVILNTVSCTNEDIVLTFDFTNITTEDSDYLNNPIQITIPAGTTNAEVIVPTITDSFVEGDETFLISIASLDSGYLNNSTDTAIGTILDANTIDLDSDNDGILDSIEDLNTDGDNDPSTNPTNSDTDIYPDYLDIDSDNDGIPDNVEAQTTTGYIPPSLIDANDNGVDDAYETPSEVGLIPVNTDAADLPDYLDLDSDNDNIADHIEGHDHDQDGIADVIFIGSDKDDDGLDDSFEGIEQLDIDVNDEIDDPINDLPNTDGDSESDYRDLDDDNDGIPTMDEDTNGDMDYINDDWDNDGVPDYLDPDLKVEIDDVEIFNVVTPNGDGVHDILTITGLETRPDNNLSIYNRWGILVFSTESYNTQGNFFDGTSKARSTVGDDERLPTGTYFYLFDYVDVDGQTVNLSGHLYLN